MHPPSAWTSRQRMLAAYQRRQADRVPACPDISYMVPARLNGRPYWEVFLYNDPPIGMAYLDAVRYFGMDGMYWYDDLEEVVPVDRPRWESRIEMNEHAHVRTDRAETPYGELTRVEVFPHDDAPWLTVKPIKDVERDFPAFKRMMGDGNWEWVPNLKNRDVVGESCIYECMIQTPIDWWFFVRDGGYQNVLLDLFDKAEYMRQEVFAFYYTWALTKLEAILAARPDAVWLGGSGSSLSVSSPTFYRMYDLPLIKAVTERCHQAGVISHQHTCGKSALLVEINYNETELDVMEPLEEPPGGDVDLAQVKERFGDRLCLKGNINTFETMLRATPKQVQEAARRCIEAAAEGGGFVLSTGDQCGRDTPFDNIFALVETAKTYGRF